MMVLKVALKDISPQIVRRIAVPDTFTLGDLHLMIQAAMGWTTSHPHAFVINGTEYSDPDDVDSGDVDFIDEREVTLAELLHSPRKSFTYIYDFGDNWRHAVTVERFIPLAPDSSSSPVEPACLSGKRACPPEDCGSIPGYYHLVEALACPEAERTEEMRESIEWAGDWDPERFNLDDANQRIVSIFQDGIPPG